MMLVDGLWNAPERRVAAFLLQAVVEVCDHPFSFPFDLGRCEPPTCSIEDIHTGRHDPNLPHQPPEVYSPDDTRQQSQFQLRQGRGEHVKEINVETNPLVPSGGEPFIS